MVKAVLAALLLIGARAEAQGCQDYFTVGYLTAGYEATGYYSVGGCVNVPDVTSQPIATATLSLQAVGLDAGVLTSRCSAQAVNNVIDQTPGAGLIAIIGDLVNLSVSNGMACPPGDRKLLRLNLEIKP